MHSPPMHQKRCRCHAFHSTYVTIFPRRRKKNSPLQRFLAHVVGNHGSPSTSICKPDSNYRGSGKSWFLMSSAIFPCSSSCWVRFAHAVGAHNFQASPQAPTWSFSMPMRIQANKAQTAETKWQYAGQQVAASSCCIMSVNNVNGNTKGEPKKTQHKKNITSSLNCVPAIISVCYM